MVDEKGLKEESRDKAKEESKDQERPRQLSEEELREFMKEEMEEPSIPSEISEEGIEIDPDGFSESIGILIAGLTGQDESFVEHYKTITGTVLKMTGAQVISVKSAYERLPGIVKVLLFGAIIAVPAGILLFISKKTEQRKALKAQEQMEREAREKKPAPPPAEKEPIFPPGGIVKERIIHHDEEESSDKRSDFPPFRGE